MLCLDVPTRWNSTYLMLEVAEKFQKAFECLEEDDPRFKLFFMENDDENENANENDGGRGKGKGKRFISYPKEEDWEVARVFVKFLRLFYHVTLQLSGSLHVTSNVFFHQLVSVQSKLVQLSKNGDVVLSNMADKMKLKYDKYWENLDNINFLLYVAVVLDPRYKLTYLKFSFNKVYENDKVEILVARVKATLERLFDHYVEKNNVGNVAPSYASQAPQVMEVDEEEKEDPMTLFASQYINHLESEKSVENKSELEKYLVDDCVDPRVPNFDILNWWKVNGNKYKVLSLIAKDVLAVPVSTVASESAFSTSGRVLDPFRSSLTPKMVEALICAQNWLRSSSIPINLRECMDDVEQYEEIESEFFSSSTAQEATIVED
ncbi:unnamed protein product [Camellia sinensis]